MTFLPGAATRRRGQPLIVLGAVMLCWIGVRAAVLRTEFEAAAIPPLLRASAPGQSARVVLPGPVGTALPARSQAAGTTTAVAPAPGPAVPPRTPLPPGPAGLAGPHHPASQPPPRSAGFVVPPAALPPPPAIAAIAAGRDGPPARHWSADGWMLMRGGGGIAGAGPSVATYGASQVGAVLRYRLWPGDRHRLTTYLRVSAALGGSGEREAALGLAARPLAALPVVIAAEGRVGRLSGRTVARPAVMAVTELAPIAVAKSARAEFYLQGGYVGGLGATPFIDGQLRADRRIARLGPAELRGGGGIWGGAQQGAERLDIGPAASLQVSQGRAAMRLGIDWRFRLAGSAAPASGPALTISAGF